MHDQLKDYKTWLLMVFVAFLLLTGYRASIELITGNSKTIEAAHSAIYDRLDRLELSKTPATMKRYTSDDAVRDKAELLVEIELLKREHETIRKEIRVVRRLCS